MSGSIAIEKIKRDSEEINNCKHGDDFIVDIYEIGNH